MNLDPDQSAALQLINRHEIDCPDCGYALKNLPEPRCPECGLIVTAADVAATLEELPRGWHIRALEIVVLLALFGPLVLFFLLPAFVAVLADSPRNLLVITFPFLTIGALYCVFRVAHGTRNRAMWLLITAAIFIVVMWTLRG